MFLMKFIQIKLSTSFGELFGLFHRTVEKQLEFCRNICTPTPLPFVSHRMYYLRVDFVNSRLKTILCSILKSKPLLKVLKWLARPSAWFSAHIVRYDSAPGVGGY